MLMLEKDCWKIAPAKNLFMCFPVDNVCDKPEWIVRKNLIEIL